MYNSVVVFLISAVAIFAAMMILIEHKVAVGQVLKQNRWGYFTTAVGLILGAYGLSSGLEWFLTFGGILFGLGVLVALPDPVTDFLIHKRNIWLFLFGGGLLLFLVWGFGPSWKYIIQFIGITIGKFYEVVWLHSEFSQAVWMTLGVLLGFVGLVGFVVTLFRQAKKNSGTSAKV